jgi:4-aminobutyrate aminotransferase / (S)-3-amino-2-methylpropionate transaminase / 5-aminovalerate transaminase
MVRQERAIELRDRIVQQRKLVSEIPGRRSRELQLRRRAAVASGVSSALPVFIDDAEGSVIRDVDGNTFIDLGSGIAVTGLGHVNPAVLQAITAQAGRFNHTCFMVGPYESYVELCEELSDLTPGDHEKRSALFTSGAEAVENAVKIARRATGRAAVVVFDHAYHGRTNMTMALTAKQLPYKDGFGPFAPEVYRVPMSYPLRDGEGMSGERAARRAIDQLTVQVGATHIACVLIEPIQGEGGFVVPAPGFLPTLERWCRDHGVIFAVDEIQTGFGRTGDWFASEHEGLVPDLVITAKAIASGLPLSAVTGRAEIMESVSAGGLGGTYGGNPVACAAALATIASMRELDAPFAARRIEAFVLPRLLEMQRRYPAIAEVRGRGAMLALELVMPGTLQPDAATCRLLAESCFAAGVIVLTCGTYGNVIRLLPPLVISEVLLDDAVAVFENALAHVLG